MTDETALPPNPSYKSPRYTPITCAVCQMCYFDNLRGHCVYGGPFSGYTQPTEKEQ
jgi:hypothetical protein